MSRQAPKACLKVRGTDIVDADGSRVVLKGVSKYMRVIKNAFKLRRDQCATGGHTNMENFITGYPGYESEMRAAMLEVLGKDKYDFFFDKVCCFLQYAATRSLTCTPYSFWNTSSLLRTPNSSPHLV